jgi:hypothetical protein
MDKEAAPKSTNKSNFLVIGSIIAGENFWKRRSEVSIYFHLSYGNSSWTVYYLSTIGNTKSTERRDGIF